MKLGIFQSLETKRHRAELLYLCFLKIRDNDEKVRRAAFRRLADFPLATLAQHFQACDWQLVFQHGFREEGTADDVQVSLLTTGVLHSNQALLTRI